MGVFTDAIPGSRWLVVVRRGDDSTYEYLRSRLASVRGVEVTLDRRQTPVESDVPTDRRGEPTYFNAFGVLLARR
jgi:hypothetical protein